MRDREIFFEVCERERDFESDVRILREGENSERERERDFFFLFFFEICE